MTRFELPPHTWVEYAFDKETKAVIEERERLTTEYLEKWGDPSKLFWNYTWVHYIIKMLIEIKWYKMLQPMICKWCNREQCQCWRNVQQSSHDYYHWDIP